jgi:transcriptional regulator with XRE-family HTH domain
MDLADKLKDLRHHAGHARGLGRPLTQAEVAHGVRARLGGTLSQGYISQIERGRRVHLSQQSREVLARFFGVHPGYLVSDPDPAHQHETTTLSFLHHPSHPIARRTLARLAVHPRRQQVWPIVDHLIDLSEDDFHTVRNWIEERLGAAANGERPLALVTPEGE